MVTWISKSTVGRFPSAALGVPPAHAPFSTSQTHVLVAKEIGLANSVSSARGRLYWAAFAPMQKSYRQNQTCRTGDRKFPMHGVCNFSCPRTTSMRSPQPT